MTPPPTRIKNHLPKQGEAATLPREYLLRLLHDLKRRVKTLEEKLDETIAVVRQTTE